LGKNLFREAGICGRSFFLFLEFTVGGVGRVNEDFLEKFI